MCKLPSIHPLGATALGEPWSPQQPVPIALNMFLILSRLIVGFRNKLFLLPGVVSPTPKPNLEDQGIPFRLAHHP